MELILLEFLIDLMEVQLFLLETIVQDSELLELHHKMKEMKKRILFLLSILLLYSMQVAAQFEGSNGDGYDNRTVSSITLTNLSLEVLYDGSNGDGFARRGLSATTLQNISLSVLYEGSSGDGFSNRLLSATTLDLSLIHISEPTRRS